MTGDEHYAAAEALLDDERMLPISSVAVVAAQAQVHATLALASYTATLGAEVGNIYDYITRNEHHGW